MAKVDARFDEERNSFISGERGKRAAQDEINNGGRREGQRGEREKARG